MNKEQLLTQLRDIHNPSPVSWWPLAPGWYFLWTIILIILILTLWYYKKKHKKNKIIKRAQKRLNLIYTKYNNNPHQYANQASLLLKRICLYKYPSAKIKHLYGVKWGEFLNQISNSKCFNDFAIAAYNHKHKFDIDQLHKIANKTIANIVKK